MEAIILLGGPGAGKGTLAEVLKKQTDYLHVSTGDMLRAATQAGTSVGTEAKSYMDSGKLVPDAVILRIIEERISEETSPVHFMFDGFPRTIEQAEGLDRFFKKQGGLINHVFNLVVDREALLTRLTGRRICKTCGAVYHTANKPPKKSGICDIDGGELYQRADDSEATILNRLEVYKKQTAPLITFYQQKDLLCEINAGGSPAETLALVFNVLNA
jgi:adenylate kinase